MHWIEQVVPVKLGLPPKYTEWRPGQADAIGAALESDKRFVAISAPTGLGKSLVGIAAALAEGKRVVYLTSTKALQNQLMDDFEESGLRLVKGRNNYDCASNPQFTCEEYSKACRAKLCQEHGSKCRPLECEGWGGRCEYRQHYKAALESKLVVTNYSYWVLVNKFAQGLGPVDILILDEAHNAPAELSDLMSVTITPHDLDFLRLDAPKDDEVVQAWGLWSKNVIARAMKEEWMSRYAQAEREGGQTLREKNRLEKLLQKVGTVAQMHGHWVVEATKDGFRLDPVWPFQHAEGWLFKGIERIVLLSATLTPKTLALLGVAKDKYSFHSYPYVFPRKRAPVFHVKTAAISYHTKPANIQLWLHRIGQVLKRRTDRKGIIHTVSYKRQREIYDFLSTHYRDLVPQCIIHDSYNTAETVAKFKATKKPCWLLSPSVTTGYDFPGTECEFILVTKLPFPTSQSAVMIARQKDDKQYAAYLMIQDLIQSLGRGMRGASDSCEGIIIDDNWFWVRRRYEYLIPDWFKVKFKDSLPGPPASIREIEELTGNVNVEPEPEPRGVDFAKLSRWRKVHGSYCHHYEKQSGDNAFCSLERNHDGDHSYGRGITNYEPDYDPDAIVNWAGLPSSAVTEDDVPF